MKNLYVIACSFQLIENGEVFHGMAICSSPGDIVTFIHEDGSPAIEKEVWNYKLHHYRPWASIDVGNE